MKRMIFAAVTAVIFLTSDGLAAQDGTSSSAKTGCEIHVWPAPKLNALTEGAIWNDTIDYAMTSHGDRTQKSELPPTALASNAQLALLTALDLPVILHDVGAKVIVHDEVSKRRPTGASTGRQTDSISPCYTELTVAKNFFNRSALASRSLRTLFVLDEFGDQSIPTRSFTTWATTALLIFPAKRAKQAEAADDELAGAFRSNVEQFAKYAFAVPKKR